METQNTILLVINVVGGIAVIGSYVHSFITHPGKGYALWGGVPKSIRPIYGISMIIAALGYFTFIYYLLFQTKPDDVQAAGGIGYNVYYIIFIGILIPSALWMPSTYSMLEKPDSVKWMVVRTVLI